MASMSGRHAAGAGFNSAPAEPQMWSYAVPMDDESGDSPYTDENYGAYDGRGVNGSSKPKLRSKSSQPSPNGANGLSNRYSADQTNDEDGYQRDSYRSQSASRSRATSKDGQRVKKKTSKSAVGAITEESDKWIHREKLMQIESRELAEMTMKFGKGSRAASRAASRAGKSTKASVASVDLDHEEQEGQTGNRRRAQSSEFVDVDEEPDDNSLTGPDEMMGEELIGNSPSQEQSHSRRPSVSRIPVSKSGFGSPSDPDLASSPPSRTANGLAKTRTRSNSRKESQDATSPPAPGGAKEGANGRKVSTTRKTSTSTRQPNPGDSPKRPTTRDGGSRPSTARPEGDPPWLETMYKPDPRLPPDQQMLPTHAKRLAREREEAARLGKENQPPADEFQLMPDEESPGEYGSPSRDRPPFANDGRPTPDLSNHPAYRREPERSQWPLPAQNQSNKDALDSPPKGANQPSSPKHSSTGSGNYNLMPNVRGSREGSTLQPSSQAQSPTKEKISPHQASPVTRVPESKEDEAKAEKKEGCAGCCVVM